MLSPSSKRPAGRAWILLAPALPLLLMHAIVPMSEFVHRSDDALYYFQVAANYPLTGMWTFDGIHSTNGVQPLWALLLSALAQVLYWFGVTDADALARVFVALTAMFHFTSGLLLYRLLSRLVSPGVGLAAAGGWLFSMGVVWTHVWGMENSLYATCLLGTVIFLHLRFLPSPSTGGAILLGVLLGVTGLSRLNAGLFVPCVLGYLLLQPGLGPLGTRLRYAVAAGFAATVVVTPYFVTNLLATGHILPVSGEVKAIRTANLLASEGIDSRLSRDFLSMVYWRWRLRIEWFITSHALNGLWATGARLAFLQDTTYRVILGALAACLAIPLLAGRSLLRWTRWLGVYLARIRIFWYVLLFGTINAFVSIMTYPSEAYSIPRWWLAENELIITVIAATFLVAAIAYLSARWLGRRHRTYIAITAVATIVLLHAVQTVQTYWDGEKQTWDWNQSWNDESYRAATWMNANLPTGTMVGSWNAGVVGYYAHHSVVNLDGLINNFDLLPFLEEGRIADYITQENIEYLSDMSSMFERTGVLEQLPLTEVYRHYSPLMDEHYQVYRVVRQP